MSWKLDTETKQYLMKVGGTVIAAILFILLLAVVDVRWAGAADMPVTGCECVTMDPSGAWTPEAPVGVQPPDPISGSFAGTPVRLAGYWPETPYSTPVSPGWYRELVEPPFTEIVYFADIAVAADELLLNVTSVVCCDSGSPGPGTIAMPWSEENQAYVATRIEGAFVVVYYAAVTDPGLPVIDVAVVRSSLDNGTFLGYRMIRYTTDTVELKLIRPFAVREHGAAE